MSYVTEVFMNRQIAKAAQSLDIIQAAQNHKLEGDSKKFTLLSTVIREHAQRFSELSTHQTVMSADEFFKRALERVQEMRREAAVIAKARADKRRQHQLEREQILATMSAA